MNPRPARSLCRRPLGIAIVRMLVLALALFAPVRGAPADESDVKTIDRPNFILKYPATWKEMTDAADYKANSDFTLQSPHESYVQFSIVDKSEDPDKVLKAALQGLDGPAITTLSRTKISEWGQNKGSGMHLKGKILDSAPGGIKLFIFNSEHHNVLVIEFYYSSELKDVQGEMDYISQNFKMKN